LFQQKEKLKKHDKNIKKMKIQKQIMPVLGTTAGAVLAEIATNKIIPQTLPAAVRNGAPLIIGVLLMSQKGALMQNIGAGMVAVGGAKLAKTFVPGLAGLTQGDMDAVMEDISEDLNTLNEDISEDISEDFSTLNEDFSTLNEDIS
jgi:hypothetical protein